MPDVKQRPSWLKALGSAEPPESIHIDAIEYRLVEVYKHDSWAATARYESLNSKLDERPKKIICKFNRRSSCFGLPLAWVGRTLAARESSAYSTLAELDAVPPALGDVFEGDKHLRNAFAHEFVEGHPLGKDEHPHDEFFPALQNALSAMHELGVVYMDLHKRENILVGADGLPKLVDFQISVQHRPRGWLSFVPGQWLRNILRKSDLFCFEKHLRRLRPDQAEMLGVPLSSEPPWWIRAHRMVAVPFRQCRRRLLSWLRVRDRSGRCRSELFAEHAFREPLP